MGSMRPSCDEEFCEIESWFRKWEFLPARAMAF